MDSDLNSAIAEAHHWRDQPFPLEGECRLVQTADSFANNEIVFVVKTKSEARRMLSNRRVSVRTLDDAKSPLAYCDKLLSAELFAHRAYWYCGLWC